MKTYTGEWQEMGGCEVLVNGLPLNPRNDLYDHSPDGMRWSYGGSGCAQLALAILADLYDDKLAMRLHQPFKWLTIANFPKEDFKMTEEQVRKVVKQIQDE